MFYNLKKKNLLTFALTLGLALGTAWHTPCSAEVIVDQEYDPYSANAVSGVAMAGVLGNMEQFKYMSNVSRANLIDIPMVIDMDMDMGMGMDIPGVGDAPHVASADNFVNVIGNLDSSIGDQGLFQQMNYIKEATDLVTAFGYLDQQVNANEENIKANKSSLDNFSKKVGDLQNNSDKNSSAIGNLEKLKSMSNVNMIWMQDVPMAMDMADDGVGDMPSHGTENVSNLVDAIGNLNTAIGDQYYYQQMNYVQGATNVVTAVGYLDEQINANENKIKSNAEAINALKEDVASKATKTEVDVIDKKTEINAQAIAEETVRAKEAEGKNAKAIADETARAKEAEEALGKRIDGLEVNSTDLGPVNAKLDKLGDRIEKVGANAAALAALHPMPTDDGDKLSVAIGGGTYRDKYATALGLFYRPSDRVMLSLAGSTGSGESMANVGLSFALDREVKGMPSRKALNAQVKELKAENAVQAEQIKMLIERIEALEAKK